MIIRDTMNNDNLDQRNYISLADWVSMHDSMEEKREFLLNADLALKFLNSFFILITYNQS